MTVVALHPLFPLFQWSAHGRRRGPLAECLQGKSRIPPRGTRPHPSSELISIAQRVESLEVDPKGRDEVFHRWTRPHSATPVIAILSSENADSMPAGRAFYSRTTHRSAWSSSRTCWTSQRDFATASGRDFGPEICTRCRLRNRWAVTSPTACPRDVSEDSSALPPLESVLPFGLVRGPIPRSHVGRLLRARGSLRTSRCAASKS